MRAGHHRLMSHSNTMAVCERHAWQKRLRSLRSRSTIMRFSALAFADDSSAALAAASRAGSSERAAVPLMGRASTTPP